MENYLNPRALPCHFIVRLVLDDIHCTTAELILVERNDVMMQAHRNTLHQFAFRRVDIHTSARQRLRQVDHMRSRIVVDRVVGECQMFGVGRFALRRESVMNLAQRTDMLLTTFVLAALQGTACNAPGLPCPVARWSSRDLCRYRPSSG